MNYIYPILIIGVVTGIGILYYEASNIFSQTSKEIKRATDKFGNWIYSIGTTSGEIVNQLNPLNVGKEIVNYFEEDVTKLFTPEEDQTLRPLTKNWSEEVLYRLVNKFVPNHTDKALLIRSLQQYPLEYKYLITWASILQTKPSLIETFLIESNISLRNEKHYQYIEEYSSEGKYLRSIMSIVKE